MARLLPILSVIVFFAAPLGAADAQAVKADPRAALPAAPAGDLPDLIPPAYRPILRKHGTTPARLKRWRFDFVSGRCVRFGRELSPEDLDIALSDLKAAESMEPRRIIPNSRWIHGIPDIPSRDPQAKEKLDSLFEGSKTPERAPPLLVVGSQVRAPSSRWSPLKLASGSTVPGNASAQGVPSSPAATLNEPEFEPSWRPIAKKLWDRNKTRNRDALRELAARFQPAETETGLSQEAPEALRMLTLALGDGKGGKHAYVELQRELVLVANLKAEQKKAFAGQLKSPWPAYLSLAVSHAPHFSDAQLYFARMEELLSQKGLKVTDYIRAKDSRERYASAFILRAHAYDALMPYLNRNPSEAGAAVSYLFSDNRTDLIRTHATQLEAFASQLAAFGRDSGALDRFVQSLLDQSKSTGQAAVRAALFLKLNEPFLPRKYREQAAAAAADLPEGLLKDPTLSPASPYDFWPEDRLTFSIHFPREDSYLGWLRYFQERGYAVERTSREGVSISKEIEGVTVILIGKRYAGDIEGYLKDAESKRFLDTVSRDLGDPSIQGVIVRTHAQFHYPELFKRNVSEGKLWLDGSCRGGWYRDEIEKACPTCAIVTNTGTGMSEITTPALYALLDGLARRWDWNQIYQGVKRPLPRAVSRMTGPWTPRFGRALDLLREYGRKRPAASIPRNPQAPLPRTSHAGL